MAVPNDLTIYDDRSVWWKERPLWLRVLRNLVPARLRYLEQEGIDWRGRTVVDVGCGGGFFTEALAERGARMIGIDPAPGAIEAARAHAQARGLAIDYRIAVGEALPIESASVDGVVCVDVLEHVEDPAQVVAEIARVLRPAGTAFFDTVNRNPLATLALVHVGETLLRVVPRGCHDPRRFIRPSELRDLLARNGLDPAPFAGLGPVGVDRRGALRFGRYPVTWVQYMGHAVRDATGPLPVRADRDT